MYRWLVALVLAMAAACGDGGGGAPDGGYANACGPVDEEASQPNTLLANIPRDGTLTADCSPYRVEQPVVITGTLTIEPGVEIIACEGGCRSRITIGGDGKLIAQGTADEPIVFTSSFEGTLPRGQWTGILFLEAGAGSILEHVIIELAGGPYSPLQDDDEFNRYEFPVDGSLLNDSTPDLTLRNVTVRRSRGYAIAATTKDGFELQGGDVYTEVTGVTLVDNAEGIWLPVDQGGNLGGDVCFFERDAEGACPTGGTAPADVFVELHSDDRLGRTPENVTRDATWVPLAVPHKVDNVSITNGATLVVQDGMDMRMTGLGGITVGVNDAGALHMVAASPGGITIGSAFETPTANQFWDGISIWNNADGANTRIENVDIGYGGARSLNANEAPANIQIFGSNPTIVGNHVHHSQGMGIHWSCSASPPGLESAPLDTNTVDTTTIACATATMTDGIAANFGCPCPMSGCQDRCQ